MRYVVVILAIIIIIGIVWLMGAYPTEQETDTWNMHKIDKELNRYEN